MSNESINTTIDSIYVTSMQPNRIKFGIFVAVQLLSMPCFFNGFLQCLGRRKLRETVSFHVIFLLLFNSFLFVTVALPLTQAYLYTSFVYPASDVFCSFWNWFHYSVNIVNLFLMAFISIERNLLVFHPNLFRTERGKFLFHYCPILFCLIYPPVFYIGAIFIWPCTNYYDYTQLFCTWPCYFGNQILTSIDLFFNNYTPLLIIPIFCAILYIRVYLQKQSMQLKANKWRRDKKLILQLLIISSLYLTMWMPLQILGLINLYWDPSFLIQPQMDYLYLFPYFIHVVYPFVVYFIIPKNRIDPNQFSTAMNPTRQ